MQVSCIFSEVFWGGGRCWIRTSEGVSQQIYSLPPLATWVTYQCRCPFRKGCVIKPNTPKSLKRKVASFGGTTSRAQILACPHLSAPIFLPPSFCPPSFCPP